MVITTPVAADDDWISAVNITPTRIRRSGNITVFPLLFLLYFVTNVVEIEHGPYYNE